MDKLPARILPLRLAPGRRVLVISDIHGNLPYFDALLEQAGFCGEDELILDGDFLEKGPDSLGTLRRVMELAEGAMFTPSAATATTGMTSSTPPGRRRMTDMS